MKRRDITAINIVLLDKMVNGLARGIVPDLTPEEASQVDDAFEFLESVDAEGLGFEVTL